MSRLSILPGYAVVTGAASGMGQATAVALAVTGVSGIALLDINITGLEATKALCLAALDKDAAAPKISIHECDVSSPEAIDETYAMVQKSFGRIDYSINCAGIVRLGASLDQSIADFDLQNSINYRGLWLCQRAALTHMRTQTLNNEAYPDSRIPYHRAQRGAIVNFSSCVSQRSVRGTPVYNATKAAVLSLTSTDAADYAPDRIRINAIMPGSIDTPLIPSKEMRKELEQGLIARSPAGRFGTAEEVADVIVFLCGTGASFVTGSGWLVDGGLVSTIS